MGIVGIIDNRDSFTLNLKHYLESFVTRVDVILSSDIPTLAIQDYDAFVISPGPDLPKDHLFLFSFLEKIWKKKPILGVCLGMQAMAELIGGSLFSLEKLHHGVPDTLVRRKEDKMFEGINMLQIGRYHSFGVLVDKVLEKHFVPTSFSKSDGCMMSMKHRKLPIVGVQFHPESIITPCGKTMLGNWVKTWKNDIAIPLNNSYKHGY